MKQMNRRKLLSYLTGAASLAVPATWECTGNSHGLFRPRVPGVQWMRGAIGNAEWTRPCLTDVYAANPREFTKPSSK